jgi:hypothetical protein
VTFAYFLPQRLKVVPVLLVEDLLLAEFLLVAGDGAVDLVEALNGELLRRLDRGQHLDDLDLGAVNVSGIGTACAILPGAVCSAP